MIEVLIIEDEPGIADNIVYALKTESIEAHHVATGAEGLDAFGAKQWSIVILDIGLPDMSGLDVCKTIRKTSSVPIIFLTARSEEVDRIVGLEVGADDYVVKPFSPRELVARVRAILRRVQPNEISERETTSIPFEVDENRHHVLFFGEKVVLSHYEFEILKKLISKPGWVFSRDALIESIWEDPGMVTDRTVDAHVKSIRQKLRSIRDTDAILTHRSIGYSLREDW
jgi:two-component system catabolic regulation response regulator CreB